MSRSADQVAPSDGAAPGRAARVLGIVAVVASAGGFALAFTSVRFSGALVLLFAGFVLAIVALVRAGGRALGVIALVIAIAGAAVALGPALYAFFLAATLSPGSG
ncbi:hypothetical protein [Microbacterium sp. KR10-403]|uniref:hypothetical protein n=1 Tax=Microbacterium sp. KR10-403 TaxID=3158581 RepID=UPI0032E401E9